MVKCPFCQVKQVENTIFCSECGHYLLENDDLETDHLPKENGTAQKTPESIREAVDPLAMEDSGQAQPQAIRLEIGPERRRVEAPLHKPLHIGRIDPSASYFPVIDLSQEGDLSKTISRRHARIVVKGQQVAVEDLGSANGTYLNGQRIEPYLYAALHSGDTLQLGKLPIKVQILKR